MVLSLDMSVAVDANFATNGRSENVLIVQGDITQMPFPYDYADRLASASCNIRLIQGDLSCRSLAI
jgi:hypothetical protein